MKSKSPDSGLTPDKRKRRPGAQPPSPVKPFKLSSGSNNDMKRTMRRPQGR